MSELDEFLADPDPAMRRLAMDEVTRAELPDAERLTILLRGFADPARAVRDAATVAFIGLEARLRPHLTGAARHAVDDAAALGHADVDRHIRAMAALPLDDPEWYVAVLAACLTLLDRARREGWSASQHAIATLLAQRSPSALWESLRNGLDATTLGALAALPTLPAWTWEDVTSALARGRRDVATAHALVRARTRAATAVPAAAAAAVTDAIARLAQSTDPLDRIAAVQLIGMESWALLETASWDADPRVRDAVKLELERLIAAGRDVDRAWRMIDRLAAS